MSESNIAWPSDREKKFKDPDPAALNAAIAAGQVQYINQTYPGVNSITNEHFIVWMRVAAVPNFRKLYGRIEQDIPAGTTLTFNVASTYNVAKFQGSKSLVISTTSFMGGKNPFLGIAYIVVGFVCILLALLFGVRQLFGGRRLGDTAFLVWNSRK
ncbi:hypothetical protein EON67_03775 [archaeon]|nr:MAG: hypothetical protein EON67_03775 [archaeon]